MATNSLLNVLSRQFFDYARSKSRILSSDNVIKNEEKTDNTLLQATLTVRHFYSYIFREKFKNDKTEYQKSKEEFCCFVHRMCNRENWFRKLTVFERCFVIISYVFSCYEYLKEQHVDVKSLLKETRVVWEEYFIEYIEEFHKKGGWTELIRVAHSYAAINNLMCIFHSLPDKDSTRFSKSVENYLFFCLLREDVPEEKTKSKILKTLLPYPISNHKTCASIWIKFVLENASTPMFYAISKPPQDTLEVTVLLRILRDLCDPNFPEEKEQEFSNSVIENVPLQNILQKSYENKNSDFENLIMSENVECKSPFITSVTGEILNKSSTTVENECENKDCNIKNFIRSEEDGVKNVSLFSPVADGVFGKFDTAVEKECVKKNSNIKYLAGGEIVGPKNLPLVSRVPGKIWSTSNVWMKVCKKGRVKISDEICNFNEAMTACSIFNNSLLQKATIINDRKDSDIENFSTCRNDGYRIVNNTSSIAGEMVKTFNKQGKKRKKKQKKDKSSQSVNPIEQEPSNPICNNVPLPMGNEMLKRSNKGQIHGRKIGLQVSDRNVERSEATVVFSNPNTGVSLQNVAVEKENADKGIVENVAGDDNDKASRESNGCSLS